MTLFLKHILRSMRRKPLQPIILTFTLALAIAILIFSFTANSAIHTEMSATQKEQYGESTVVLSLSSTSESRFMFTNQVKEILGEETLTAGTFELPLTFREKKETVFGIAVDFYEIGNIFDIELTGHGVLTPSLVPYSAYVSSDFAEKNSLSVGDSFTAVAFGEDKTYTVMGISEKGFLASYDVMVDVSSVVRIMSKDSLLLSSIGEDFRPYSKMYVKTASDDFSVDQAIAILRSSPSFSDKEITDVRSIISTKANIAGLEKAVLVSILMSAILTMTVTFCCFYIISSERKEQNYSFILSGAKPRTMHLLQYTEALTYWIVSMALGIPLSVPLIRILSSIAGFKFSSLSLTFSTATKSVFIILAIMILTVTALILSDKKRKKITASDKILWILSIVLVILWITFSIPIYMYADSFEFWLSSFVPFVILIFITTPMLLQKFAKLSDGIFEKNFSRTYSVKRPSFRYALKNVYSIKLLQNIARLISLLTCILLLLGVVVISTFGHVESLERLFVPEYVVLNATESCSEKIDECETVGSRSGFYFANAGFINVISAESPDTINPDIKFEKMPTGNEAVISRSASKLFGVKVGQTFNHPIEGKECSFVVTEIVESATTFMIVDCVNLGIPYNMTAIRAADGVSTSELYDEISEKTALELASISSVSDLFKEKTKTISVYINVGLILLIAISLFSVIGMLDNLYESYRGRRDEFRLYELSGMSRRAIRRMKVFEILLTFSFGLIIGFLAFCLALSPMTEGLRSVGYEIPKSFVNFFKY